MVCQQKGTYSYTHHNFVLIVNLIYICTTQIKEIRTDFFPLNQAKCLNHTWSEKKLDEIKRQLNDVKNKVDRFRKVSM